MARLDIQQRVKNFEKYCAPQQLSIIRSHLNRVNLLAEQDYNPLNVGMDWSDNFINDRYLGSLSGGLNELGFALYLFPDTLHEVQFVSDKWGQSMEEHDLIYRNDSIQCKSNLPKKYHPRGKIIERGGGATEIDLNYFIGGMATHLCLKTNTFTWLYGSRQQWHQLKVLQLQQDIQDGKKKKETICFELSDMEAAGIKRYKIPMELR